MLPVPTSSVVWVLVPPVWAAIEVFNEPNWLVTDEFGSIASFF